MTRTNSFDQTCRIHFSRHGIGLGVVPLSAVLENFLKVSQNGHTITPGMLKVYAGYSALFKNQLKTFVKPPVRATKDYGNLTNNINNNNKISAQPVVRISMKHLMSKVNFIIAHVIVFEDERKHR